MEWLRSVDLAEYAPNLRGSGVHGGLIVSAHRNNTHTHTDTHTHYFLKADDDDDLVEVRGEKEEMKRRLGYWMWGW